MHVVIQDSLLAIEISKNHIPVLAVLYLLLSQMMNKIT